MYFGTGGAAFLTDIVAIIFFGPPLFAFVFSLAIVSAIRISCLTMLLGRQPLPWRSAPPLPRHHTKSKIFVKIFSLSEHPCSQHSLNNRSIACGDKSGGVNQRPRSACINACD
jgi:hypothetical protein